MLVIWGFVANFFAVFILNIAGIPGALIAGQPGTRAKVQFIFGSIVSAIGQSYVYLAYTAFIVNWTAGAIAKQGVSFIIWPVAFLAVMLPICGNLSDARTEAKTDGYVTNAQIEALFLTVLLTLVGFFIFAFIPNVVETIYNWVPYVGA